MSNQGQPVRVALISLPHPQDGPAPELLGKSLAQRQVEFARQCGCEAVVVHAHGFTPEVLVLRHQTEAAGLRLQVINNAHALAGVIGDQDSLLVLQGDLLPMADEIASLLAVPELVLVVDAGPGIQAGFERIDLDRAWAGALVVSGAAVPQLEKLPEDSDPAPSLLRIALQRRTPTTRIAENLLDSGNWHVLAHGTALPDLERKLVQRALGERAGGAVSAVVARLGLGMLGPRLAGEKRARMGSAFLFCLLLLAGLVAVWAGSAPVGFLLMALAAPIAGFAIGLARLAAAPFGAVRRWPALYWLGDLALLAGGVLAIESFWYRQALAPLVIVAGLVLLDRRSLHKFAEPVRDRGLIAVLACIGTIFMPAEQALSCIALLILLANIVPNSETQITRI